jgi:hypothetical protein
MTRVIDTGGVISKPTPAVDVKTTEQAVRCPACRAYVTNSQPDCRCS